MTLVIEVNMTIIIYFIYFVVVTIYFGLDTVGLGSGMDKSGLYAVISFYIGEFIVFLFEVYLIISKRNREKRAVPVRGKKLLPFISLLKR